MGFRNRLRYYRRIADAYLLPGESHLTFWHDQPTPNQKHSFNQLGAYYMLFANKADYTADLDSSGIPMLDYRGAIGRQYNPIAIAQWGLGNHDLFLQTKESVRRDRFIAAADWLASNLETNSHGIFVWNHHFDWEYRTRLKAPWYSALAQGQGISLLVRSHAFTGSPIHLEKARDAFGGFLKSVDDGGLVFRDDAGHKWLEEYIVSPPTHILNGFIWALWGVYDYFLATRDPAAEKLFADSIETLKSNLARYDTGFWSLYEQSGTLLPMVASPFYHRLHIVQLRIMAKLANEPIFARYADRWEQFAVSRARRIRALCYKSAFKLCYY